MLKPTFHALWATHVTHLLISIVITPTVMSAELKAKRLWGRISSSCDLSHFHTIHSLFGYHTARLLKFLTPLGIMNPPITKQPVPSRIGCISEDCSAAVSSTLPDQIA